MKCIVSEPTSDENYFIEKAVPTACWVKEGPTLPFHGGVMRLLPHSHGVTPVSGSMLHSSKGVPRMPMSQPIAD